MRSTSASTIIATSSSKSTFGVQPSFSRAFDGVADQQIDFGGTEELVADAHVVFPVEANTGEGQLDELLDLVRLSGRHHVVVGLVLLEHQPHRFDVVTGEAVVTL